MVPLLRPLMVLAAATALSGCVFAVPVLLPPTGGPAGAPVMVTLDGRELSVRRSSESFPQTGPISTLTEGGITVAPPQGTLVRGQGEPAVVVGGTQLGEWALAERAVRAVCAIPEGGDAAAGFDITRRSFDARPGEALYPVAVCPPLD